MVGICYRATVTKLRNASKLSADLKRWLFLVLMLLWLVALPVIGIGFGFAGFRPEAVAIVVAFLALPPIAHALLIREKPARPQPVEKPE